MADDGIFGAFNAPPASQEMFKELVDKTDIFTDPMGSETLGAVNRAIVSAPIDAIDMVGRAGDTILRGAAKAGSGIMSAFGEDDAMAERFGRDVYQALTVAPVATAMAPLRPRGKSNKTLVLEAQKDKLKSPSAKSAIDEDIEIAALRDSFDDAAEEMTTAMEMSIDRPSGYLSADDAFDIIQDSYLDSRGLGMSKSDAIAEALMKNPDVATVSSPMLKRLDTDYNFRSSSAMKRKKEGAESRRNLEMQARRANNPTQPTKSVSMEEATRMQNELSGMAIPEPAKPTFAVIEGGQPSKKKLTHDDLSTPELLTSYIISPTRNPESKLGVTRQELVDRLSSNANVQAKTQKSLDELGYGDTVPVFRTVILKDGKAMDPETVTSVSLSPRAFADTTNFLTQGKIGFEDTAIAVRYDVPRDKFVGYFPALADDIKRGVNKKIKEKGIGQNKIESFETVTNPSAHAKELIQMQDEAIVDVSGIKAKPLKYFDRDETAVMLGMESSLARKVASQEIKSGPETRAALGQNYSAVSPFNFKGTKEQFEQLNQEAAKKMFDNYERFFRGNYKQGGMVYNPLKQGIGAI